MKSTVQEYEASLLSLVVFLVEETNDVTQRTETRSNCSSCVRIQEFNYHS